MKRAASFLLLVLLGAAPALADEPLDLIREQFEQNVTRARAPELDSKRIINASNSFLKEKEPEMTAEEYALYEKVVTMLTTNVDFAMKMLEAMMNDKEPPSPAFEFILGNAYYAANQADRAEKSYRRAVTRLPNFLRAWKNLAVLYYTGGKFADAIVCFSKAVELGDRDATTFGLLGFSLEKEGNLLAAELAYMQAVNSDPKNSDWQEGLLRIFIGGKQYGRAEALLRSLLRERPTEKRFWLTAANVQVAQGKKVEATVLLETAFGLGVAEVDEQLLLGDLYAEQGLVAEAVVAYQRVLSAERNRGERKLLRFAQALIATGKLTEAEQTLRALNGDLTPQGRIALLQSRADLFIARKRWTEARGEAEALLKLSPLDGRALLTVGRSYAEEQNFSRAMLAFEAAYQISDSTYRASLELAGLELRNRRYAKSAEYLEKALSLQKTDEVQNYLARVKTLVVRESNLN